MLRRAVLVALLVLPGVARAATQCPDPYGGAGTDAGVVCNEWVSRFDGVRDHAYVRLPTGFQASKSYDLVFWFHAAYQGESAVADPRFHRQVGDDYQAITVGLSQRGEVNFMGDRFADGEPAISAQSRLAAKQDMAELLDQIASRFHVRHVIVAGASMGGYSAYRMGQLYPGRVSIMLGAVPALCIGADIPAPNCTDSRAFAGSVAVYDAARAGVFDDKLLYHVPGAAEDTQGILSGARALDAIMRGKPWYRYREVAGQGHVNFFADEYNNSLGLGEKWLIDNRAVPSLRADIRAWIAAHPDGVLDPGAEFVAPTTEAQQYLVASLRAKGGRSWPDTAVGDGGRPDGRVLDGALGDIEDGDGGGGGDGGCACQTGGGARDHTANGPLLGLIVVGWLLRRRFTQP